MKLENSTSSLDTDMAKENAVNQVVTSSKSSLNQLGSWITKNSAKLSLVGILTFSNPNGVTAQTVDVAKNTTPKIENKYGKIESDTARNTELKIGEDPIKDSVEYKKERDVLLKRWEEVMKLKEINEIRTEQSEMLMGPMNFFKRIEEKQGGVITERDGKYARAGLAIIAKTDWLPELLPLAEKSKRILQYISSQAPQQAITKN